MEDEQEQRQAKPRLRERIGRHAWVRTTALVGAGVVVGGILAGTVTAVAADGDGRGFSGGREDHRGHGDRSQSQRHDEELLTGETAEQVTEAVLAEYPDAEIRRVETDSGAVYEAHIVTTEDQRLTVLVDDDFEVTGTEEHGD